MPFKELCLLCKVFLSVPLQNVLKHNTCRVLEDDDILDQVVRLSEENGGKLEILKFVKLGFDGLNIGDIGKTIHLEPESFPQSERVEGKMMNSHVICLQMVAIVNDQCHILYSNQYCNSSIRDD